MFEKVYGRPRLGNPNDSLNDLIYVIISNKTLPKMARQVFDQLKKRFPTWDMAVKLDASEMRTILKPAGLSFVKSEQISAALRKISNDFGVCDLTRLKGRSQDEVQEYLTSLPGVSEKVAKCVMMYTMDFDVLPVDVHVHRIARRLGWTARKRSDQCHEELESLIPHKRRYAFHVDCIEHGRSVCKASKPSCDHCCIRQHCEYSRMTQEQEMETRTK